MMHSNKRVGIRQSIDLYWPAILRYWGGVTLVIMAGLYVDRGHISFIPPFVSNVILLGVLFVSLWPIQKLVWKSKLTWQAALLWVGLAPIVILLAAVIALSFQ